MRPADQLARRTSLREQQKVLTRQKLLEAADEVFAAKGYSRATVDDIVEAAGASRGTYYLYFRSKAEIVTELSESYASALRQWREILHTDRLDGPEALRGWLGEYFDLVSTHRATIRYWTQATTAETDLRQIEAGREADLLVDVTRWIARVRKSAGRTDPPRAAATRAMLLVTQLEHFTFSWHIRGWKPVRAVALDTLVEAWQRAVTGQ